VFLNKHLLGNWNCNISTFLTNWEFFLNTPVCAKVVSQRLPCFWVLVWSCNLCFIPNLSCSHKSGKTGYQLMVCRILFWQDLIEWRIGLREGKAQVKAKSTLRSGSHVRTNLDENTKFGTLSPPPPPPPFFFHCVLFSSWLLISSTVLTKLALFTLSLGVNNSTNDPKKVSDSKILFYFKTHNRRL